MRALSWNPFHCFSVQVLSLSREVGGAVVDKTHDKDGSAFTEGGCTATTMTLTKQKEVFVSCSFKMRTQKEKKSYHHCFITG